MRQTILIWSAALIAAASAIAQPKGQAKGAPRNPAQSPASQPGPKTATPQSYPVEQVQAGELRFTSQCGFCHGRDATGGETGPDLTRSELVAEDVRGNKIGPVLRAGRPDKGMPAFALSEADASAIVAFLHDQKTKFETLGGGRRAVDTADLTTGDATAGRLYFNGAGGCSGCHSVTGDLARIATRYQGLTLLQRMLYPTAGKPAPARPKVTVTLTTGKKISGRLASEDEFTIVVLDPAGARKTFEKLAVEFKIDDPMSAHFDQLGKYTDQDMHDVFAYLDTLK
ncbi:MAG TPA: c-type cytochrome [Bryobacteraceae bacterium]|nr:c-type cytochrome [Bryobacteraceae bacterium]